MSVEGPDIIPSTVNPDYECVRIGGSAHPELAEPPPEASPHEEESGPALCPQGYVPRRRRRPSYELEGKQIRSAGPPEHNPTQHPEKR
jgi:hypothetical protein